MVSYRYFRTERAIILAFAAVGISFAAMVAGGGLAVLREPVFSMAMLPAIGAALLAYPFMLVLLVPTRLDRSLPLVGGVAVASTWLGCLWLHGFGLLVGLLASVATMLLCRRWFRDVEPTACSSAQHATNVANGAHG